MSENDRKRLAAVFPFESKYVDLDGVRCHYVDEGRGETLLFVHGNPTWSFVWRQLIAALRANYRVIAVDHVGCGLSDKPQRYPYRLSRHISNLRRFVETLDLKQVTLVAHDWGGAIGLGAAAEIPDRFARIVLSNTAAFRALKIPRRILLCRVPLVGALAVRGLNLFARGAARMAAAKPQQMTPDVRFGYLCPYNSWKNRIAVLRFVQDIPRRSTHPSYQPLLEIERKLAGFGDRPVLLIWGGRDWCFTLDYLEEFQRRLPHAESHVIEDAGHYIFEDAPEELLARLQEFLSAHPL